MAVNSEQILKQALALPPQERAELVEQLLATFQSPPDPHIDELWAQEAEDRLDAYDRGELKAVRAEEVFENIPNHISPRSGIRTGSGSDRVIVAKDED